MSICLIQYKKPSVNYVKLAQWINFICEKRLVYCQIQFYFTTFQE